MLIFYVLCIFFGFLPKKILKTQKKYEKEIKAEFSISLIFFFVKKETLLHFTKFDIVNIKKMKN